MYIHIYYGLSWFFLYVKGNNRKYVILKNMLFRVKEVYLIHTFLYTNHFCFHISGIFKRIKLLLYYILLYYILYSYSCH